MKQVLALIGIMLVLVIGYLLITGVSKERVPHTDESADTELKQLTNPEYGFSLSYPGGDTGYTLAVPQEMRGNLVFARSLFRTEEYQEFVESTTPREAPPAITVAVYRNPMNLTAPEWIESEPDALYENAIGDTITEERIGDTSYALYVRAGLYAADVYVHARAGYVYVISAEYLDSASTMRTDVRPILESMSFFEPTVPAQVAHGDITVSSPTPGTEITSPLTVTGEARGTWFFEASFPITLVDWDGRIIAESYATADGEWMTEDFVGFTGEIEFARPAYGERGTLILQKDNPSGLPENDDAIEVPVTF